MFSDERRDDQGMSDPEINPRVAEQEPVPLRPGIPRQRNKVFFGSNGLRAGWRAILFFMIVVGLFLWLLVALRFLVHGRTQFGVSQITPFGLGITEFVIFALTSIAALIMSRMENRKYGDYGLPIRLAFRGDFWMGTLTGFLSISACLLAIFLFHGFRLTGLGIHGRLILSATAAWGLAFVIVGLAEEFAFRGYLQYTFTTGMGFWPSAILLSALFALAHSGNPGEMEFGLLVVFFFGLLFCFFLRRRGDLWLAVGFHAGWDWGQTFFYGVRDSGIAPYHSLFNSEFSGSRWITGGSVGPEASIFAPVVLALVALIFARVYPENRYQASSWVHPAGNPLVVPGPPEA